MNKVLPFLAVSLLSGLSAETARTLPKSNRWVFPADIVTEQYNELRAFYEGEIAKAAAARGQYWAGEDWNAVVRENREHFCRMLGVTDPLLEPKPQKTVLAESPSHTVSLLEWPVLPIGNMGATARGSLCAYAVLIVPKSAGPHPAVIAISDAAQSAADIAGLTRALPPAEQTARRLSSAGYAVLAPFFVQRRTFCQPWTDDRSWLFRLGYQVGRHLTGTEVQQVASAVTLLRAMPEVDKSRIAVAGEKQGALTALYAAALDERIRAAVAANYFGTREKAFEEPEDRTLWKHLVRFGDAEVAGMIAPRALIIDGAVPGTDIEIRRAEGYYARAGGTRPIRATSGNAGSISDEAIAALAKVMNPARPTAADYTAELPPERLAQIANTQFQHWQARLRNLAMEAYAVRQAAWQPPVTSLADFNAWAEKKRELYLDTIGRYAPAEGLLEARSALLYDEPEFAGYRLSVRVYDNVHAYGILLVPKDIRPGERRPVVFTQHGLQGKPEDALGVIPNPNADSVYDRFGWKLARRGYLVFAPMISVQTAIDRSNLARRSHLIGLTPQGMEVRKFGRVLDYLSTLEFADAERFAFYGLSYGGYTALWTAPAEPRFKVIVSSGHFNDWNIKTSDVTEGTSFLFHADCFDMFNFNLLHSFSHAEIAMLTAPRAFAVEIGDRDAVVVLPHRFVEFEMNRVGELYRKLGLADRFLIAAFAGPHKIDGHQVYPFLDRLLRGKPL